MAQLFGCSMSRCIDAWRLLSSGPSTMSVCNLPFVLIQGVEVQLSEWDQVIVVGWS
jgi:hypothetical protein